MRQLQALFLAMAALALTLSLGACSNPQYLIHPASNPMATESRQTIDKVIDTTALQPVSWGSFLFPAKGAMFKPVLPLDTRNAIVYVYRPQSKWNDQEVQSPGFFINGEFMSGLKSGSYFWFEVPASNYYFTAKRPLAVVYISTIFETNVTFVGGERYYFRYDEENPGPEKSAKGSSLIALGPLLQQAESQALLEITQTRSMGVGRVLLADPQPQWVPFDFYADAQPVPKESLDATAERMTMLRSEEEIRAEEDPEGIFQAKSQEAHWWNPTTWW
jgi:hypothetical protein